MELIRAVGWIYSPGCSTPYLALWARMPAFKADDLNKLVFDNGSKLVQLETLRGCTMLVPRDHAEAALRVRSRTFTELAKQTQMPMTEDEMARLKGSVLKSLASGPKTIQEIKTSVPPSLLREFGPECKRIGLLGSLPLAINLLKEECRILKIQSQKRLDSTEYSYTLVTSVVPEADPYNFRIEAAYSQLAQQYFKAEGPARVRDFAWWAGINVTDAMKAATELKPRLMAVEVEGTKEEYWISEANLEEFQRFSPQEYAVSLLPYRDTFLKGQREIVNRFVPGEHADKPFSRWKGKLINDPLATIIVNGDVVGVWEWNRTRKDIDLAFFGGAPPKAAEKLIKKRAGELKDFIKQNLGEIRLQGQDYGQHQMTSIHQLKTYWGRGAQVDVGA